jgi:hypothetical protein
MPVNGAPAATVSDFPASVRPPAGMATPLARSALGRSDDEHLVADAGHRRLAYPVDRPDLGDDGLVDPVGELARVAR